MVSRTLTPGSKEAGQFKRMMRQYDNKQYKLAIKTADNLLTMIPNHGETVSVKALIYSGLGRMDDAFELAKQAIRLDISSCLCWHVYGILYRMDKNYEQAQRCFASALRQEQSNLSVRRDLAALQIQCRDYEGFRESYLKMLESKGGLSANWLGYAFGQYLDGDIPGSIETITSFLKHTTEDERSNTERYERSEIIMFLGFLYESSNDVEAALRVLETNEADITDVRGMHERKAQYFLKLGKLSEAQAILERLLKENPENELYFTLLEQAHGFDDSTQFEERMSIYKGVLALQPKANLARRLPLNFAPIEVFPQLLKDYALPMMKKGVPPLFALLKPLYADAAKGEALGAFAQETADNLKKNGTFNGEGESLSPAVLVWGLHFLAQHLDYTGKYAAALETISDAIEHTPTVVELYMIKAKILKHMGRLTEAAEALDTARQLDTADRFINSKCAKYMFRAGQVEQAVETAGLFARETRNLEPVLYLKEMQCAWFELEFAQAAYNKRDIGEALSKLYAIKENFEQVSNDQFDFHAYCLRKANLGAYRRLLDHTVNGYRHPDFIKAATLAAKIFTRLYDVPPGTEEKLAQEALLAAMTESERKKYISKQRKAQRKAEAEAQQKTAKDKASKQAAGKKNQNVEFKDPTELLETKAPLDDALAFLKPALQLAPVSVGLELAAFEVYFRKSQVMLMLKSLKRAYAVDASAPEIHVALVKFLKYVKDNTELAAPVKTVIDQELASMTSEQDTAKLQASIRTKTDESVPYALAYWQAAVALGNDDATSAANGIAMAISQVSNATAKQCATAFETVKLNIDVSAEAKEAVRKACAAKFPGFDIFAQPASASEATS
eukprot:m.144252 g.144252  ORF g.144252 m.144252 type:complete len:846 (+) comp14118_c0_seq1:73-2610(+)